MLYCVWAGNFLTVPVSNRRVVLAATGSLKEALLIDHNFMLYTAPGADTLRSMVSPRASTDCVSSNSTSSGTPRSVRSKLEMYLSLLAAVAAPSTNLAVELIPMKLLS